MVHRQMAAEQTISAARGMLAARILEQTPILAVRALTLQLALVETVAMVVRAGRVARVATGWAPAVRAAIPSAVLLAEPAARVSLVEVVEAAAALLAQGAPL